MMPEWMMITLVTFGAGLAIPIGGALALIDDLQPRWLDTELRHSILAIGGGALLAAVALVLVPEGIKSLSVSVASLCFFFGGLGFMTLDRWLSSFHTQISNLIAMLADFLPEALALGASFATNARVGYLLAILIAIQNLPEGFNAYREMMSSKKSKKPSLQNIRLFLLLPLLGPLFGLMGHFFLGKSPSLVAGLMLFAGGGILYLVFQDIAPNVPLKRKWAPSLGAVVGFLMGLIGHMLLH